MKTQKVTGGGGVQLHVEETGNPQGKPILFIHGFSQCRLCWNKQMNSDLADEFRLVTLDIRGHGLSEKPQDAYGDTQLWADDIQAVITTLGLDHPVLSGWSYGGEIICDYIRHYGGENISGLNFVGAISKLGEPVFPFLSQKFLSLADGFFSNVVEESVVALQKFIRLCVHEEPTIEDFYFTLGYNTIVPPYVRAGLFDRTIENDDILAQINKPTLITHGEDDAIVLLEMGKYHENRISQAQASYYPGSGHATFWENPERFNTEIRSFVNSL
ncbi:MAG: alpha/beta hydrolase [Deltaproteobacteria bacterium]|nr:MAG: alpha/beta hydrolase [Deltaproteobacteria bacterium]